MTHACHYCGPTEEGLRPYGPEGAFVCFDCAMATPDRAETAKQQYFGLLDKAGEDSVVIVIGEEMGPRAATIEDLVNRA